MVSAKDMDHGFNLAAIRSALDSESWEVDHENEDIEVRRVWLGTVFGLTPSGKFYAPFACSNVAGCDACKGRGNLPAHPRGRVAKRMQSRAMRIRRTFDRRVKVNDAKARSWLTVHRAWKASHGPRCTACGGLGSREAYLDERWNEVTETAFASIASDHGGVCFEWLDGDAFATEVRDADASDVDGDADASDGETVQP